MLRIYYLTIVVGTLVMATSCSKSSEPASGDTRVSAALPSTPNRGGESMATANPSNPQLPNTVSAPAVASNNGTSTDAATLSSEAPTMGANPEPDGDGGTGAELIGIVKSSIEVPDSKTMYVEIESDGAIIWVASKSMEIKAGEKVRIPAGGLIMENFESKTLGRTFDRLVMTSDILKVE